MVEVVAYIYNGMLLSYKKEHLWVSFRNLEPSVQSEVNQKRKYMY